MRRTPFSSRAKPGRYTHKEVGIQLLRDPDSSHEGVRSSHETGRDDRQGRNCS